jgi:hypothetical protein
MYKYCTFDKYSLDNLRAKQLWCNHYEAFNDPFECWGIEKTGIPDPAKEWDRFDLIAKTWGFVSGHDVTKEDLFEYCSEFVHQHSMRVSHYVESARITCFSQRSDNLLMWSHYANGFRGFCIEFDKNKLLDNVHKYAEVHEVEYSEAPQVVDTMVYEVAKDQVWYNEIAIEETETQIKYLNKTEAKEWIPQNQTALKEAQELLYQLYRKMLCYKPLNWKYEEETRLILHSDLDDRVGEPYPYCKEAIKAIIIGEKASDSNVQNITAALELLGLDVPIKKAIRCKDKYEVQIH